MKTVNGIFKSIPQYPQDLQAGQAVLTVVVFMLFLGITGFFAFTFLALDQAAESREILTAEKSYYLAEASAEDVSWRILKNKNYSATETLTLNGATATTTTAASGTQLQVTSVGSVNQNFRTIKVIFDKGVGANFSYGVQVGRGGFEMQQSSQLIGSIYSAGNVLGDNSPTVTGDVFVASTSIIDGMPDIVGNAQAHLISNSTVSGSASSTTYISKSSVGVNGYADKISGSTITRDAYYFTSIGTSTVGGSLYPGSPAPADLPVIAMPITDAQISDWEAAAQDGGTYSSPCPYVLTSGTTTLGPLKINCDFTVKNSAVVVLSGPVWVVGNFSLENSGQLKISSSYGSKGEGLIADDPLDRTTSSKVNTANSTQVFGSGASSSYLTLISQNNSAETGGAEDAVTPSNTSGGGQIFYAMHGSILITNKTTLVEATAYLIRMRNNATLTYESGLNNVNFSSGPMGGFVYKQWKEQE